MKLARCKNGCGNLLVEGDLYLVKQSDTLIDSVMYLVYNKTTGEDLGTWYKSRFEDVENDEVNDSLYIVWCPESMKPVTTTYTTAKQAGKVARLMLDEQPENTFYVCRLNTRYSAETTVTKEDL